MVSGGKIWLHLGDQGMVTAVFSGGGRETPARYGEKLLAGRKTSSREGGKLPPGWEKNKLQLGWKTGSRLR